MSIPDPSDINELVQTNQTSNETVTPSKTLQSLNAADVSSDKEDTTVQAGTPATEKSNSTMSPAEKSNGAIPNLTFLDNLSTQTSNVLLSAIISDPTGQMASALKELATSGKQPSEIASMVSSLSSSQAASARKEVLTNITDAGIITSVGSITKSIHNWKTDVLTLAAKYPFKGTEAINLIRKIVQGELWNFFVETGATADPGTHDLSYFLDKIVDCYLMLDNPNTVMRDLLAMRLNSAEDVKVFTTKFKATFDKRMDDTSSMSIALSLMSRENASAIERDPTIKSLQQLNIWASKFLPLRSKNKRKFEHRSFEKPLKKRNANDSSGFRCRACCSNSHWYSECRNKKTGTSANPKPVSQ